MKTWRDRGTAGLTSLLLAAIATSQGYETTLLVDDGGLFTVATVGANDAVLTDIDDLTSINADQVVAFTGKDAAFGSQAFVVEQGLVRGVTFKSLNTSRTFMGASINDANPPLVGSMDRFLSQPNQYRLRRWNSVDSSKTTLLSLISASELLTTFHDLNDAGVACVVGFDGADSVLYAGNQSSLDELVRFPATIPLHPQISESDEVVYSEDLTNRVVTRQWPLLTETVIADGSMGFSSFGLEPGIAKGGEAVGFIGVLNGVEGLFIRPFNAPQPLELVSVGIAGFTDFDADQRVGVLAEGAPQSPGGQQVTVAFVATRSGATGVYTAQANIVDQGGGAALGAVTYALVAKAGDTVAGTVEATLPNGAVVLPIERTISSVRLSDPFNDLGSIVFVVDFVDGRRGIVRADPDRDGDGILDRWEVLGGIDLNGDGLIDASNDLPLPKADPDRKNLYVEIDAMVDGLGVSRGLSAAGRAKAEQIFADAPADQVGHAPGAGGILASFESGGDEDIPLQPFPLHSTNDWQEFKAIKAARFGTPAQRLNPAVLAAKAKVYRYCLFADQADFFGPPDVNGNPTMPDNIPDGASGEAELLGNDFMVLLGHPSWLLGFGGTFGGTDEQRLGSFLHELGHTLGLGHGGAKQPGLADGNNRKPNYRSVMNYEWQMPNPFNQKHWVPRFEDRVLPDLDENNLQEAAGIGGDPSVMVHYGAFGFKRCAMEGGPVDWNLSCDTPGNPNCNKDPNVGPLDINTFEKKDTAGISVLGGSSDWANMVIPFADSPHAAEGATPPPSGDDEFSGDTLNDMAANAPLPGTFCTAKVNSQGCVPGLTYSGAPTITGMDDFLVQAQNVLSQKPGVIVFGQSPGTMPLGGGTMCVAAPVSRLAVLFSGGNSTLDCSGTFSYLFSQTDIAAFGLQLGDEGYLQVWSRDPGFAFPNGIGLSNGLMFQVGQ